MTNISLNLMETLMRHPLAISRDPRALALAMALSASSCASAPKTVLIDGKEVPRVTQEFVGQPYSIRHRDAHPRPGGASSGLRGPGGTITGVLCGAGVVFEVEHAGDHVQLTGFIDTEPGAGIGVQMTVKDVSGQRVILGQLGTRVIDLRLRPNQIVGGVGSGGTALEGLDLRQEGDELKGEVHLRRNEAQTIHIRLTGRDALWALPPADQAIVVPMLLACLQADPGYQRGNDPQVMGFGGAAGAMPPGTLIFNER